MVRFDWSTWCLAAWLAIAVTMSPPSTASAQQLGCYGADGSCTAVDPAACIDGCAVCRSTSSVDAGVSDGSDVHACLPSHCVGLCPESVTGCPNELVVLPARDGLPAWRVPRIPGAAGHCVYAICDEEVDLTSGSSPCLGDGSSIAERLSHGDCDADGVPNFAEHRGSVVRYACLAAPPLLRLGRTDMTGRVEIEAPARCGGSEPPCASAAEVCVGGLCTQTDSVSIEACVPVPGLRGDEVHCLSGGFCVESSLIDAVPPRFGASNETVLGLCLPEELRSVGACFAGNIGACGDRGATTLASYLANGDCDSDGTRNIDDVSVIDGTEYGLACIPSIAVWARSGTTLDVEVLPYVESDAAFRAGLCAMWSATRLRFDSMFLRVCHPASLVPLALAGAWPARNIPCLERGDASVCIPGATAAGLECSLDALERERDEGRPGTCFRAGAGSFDALYGEGNCDGTTPTNATDDTVCGADASTDFDAAIDEPDAGVSDAGRRDAARREPDGGPPAEGIAFGGGSCGCRTQRSSGTRLGWLVVLGALLRRRRR